MSDSDQPPPATPEGGPSAGPPPGGYGSPPGPGGPGYGEPGYGYQQAPPPPYAPSGVGQPADLLMRFLARLIDYVLLWIVTALVVSVVVVGILMGGPRGFLDTGPSYLAGVVSAVLTAAIYLGYFTVMEASLGQTVGKMLLKLRTEGPGGARPTLEQALRRNVWVAFGLLGLIPVVGGVIGWLAQLAAMIAIAVTINNSPTRQGWHDHFGGGTRVIRIG
ncbi:MAG: RDD family protein [Nocardioidaceae bacterium]